jgi:NTP pyrophosphatase (non-canonical NTP hydrolase)
MSDNIGQYQAENATWVSRNFPEQQPHHPFLGIVEELGELVEALDQPGNQAALVDAFGDVQVYALNYCTRQALDLQLLLEEAWDRRRGVRGQASVDRLLRNAYIALGKVSHAHLKTEQKIRGCPTVHRETIRRCLGDLFFALYGIAQERGIDMDRALTLTWQAVKGRDWQADPLAGGEYRLP